MTWLDFVILFAILGFMGLGFAQGLIRRLIDLLSLYLGLIVTSLYEPQISRRVTATLGPSDTPGREVFLFLLLLMIVVIAVNVLGYLGYRNTALPFSGTLDRVGGLFVGLLTGLVWVLITIILIHFLIQVSWPTYDNVRQFFVAAWDHSLLVPTFANGVSILGKAISPWLPAGLPVVFSIQ
ncbi:MAG: CvpA family protein [Chloroflexi bacterium]|nr:CvpA family protein [Chloroflexota bacterium]